MEPLGGHLADVHRQRKDDHPELVKMRLPQRQVLDVETCDIIFAIAVHISFASHNKVILRRKFVTKKMLKALMPTGHAHLPATGIQQPASKTTTISTWCVQRQQMAVNMLRPRNVRFVVLFRKPGGEVLGSARSRIGRFSLI
jgi:hypothetical protein